MYHPLDPLAAEFAPELIDGGGGVALAFSADGHAFLGGYGSALAHAEKGGEGEVTGLDGGILVAHGEKGGEGRARLVDAPYVLGFGQHEGIAHALVVDHGYLEAEGEKSVTAGIGYAVIRGHPALFVEGLKAVDGYAVTREVAEALAHGEKGGNGWGRSRDAGHLLSLGEKGAEGYGASRDSVAGFALGEKGGLGYGLNADGPYLLVFGQKLGGTTAAEGFAYSFQPSRLVAFGSKTGLLALAFVDEHPVSEQDVTVSTGVAGRAQSFIAPAGARTVRLWFNLAKSAGAAGSITAQIFAGNGTHGVDAVPTGAAIGSSLVLDASSLPTNPTFGWTAFDVPLPGLVPGATYCAALDVNVPSGSVYVGADSTTGHAGNASIRVTSWLAYGAADFIFRVEAGGTLTAGGRLSAQGGKAGTGYALDRDHAYVLALGAKSGEAFNFDPAITLAQGEKGGAGHALLFGHARMLADGSFLYVGPPPENIIYVVPRNWLVEL